jgi:hypothetical protein
MESTTPRAEEVRTHLESALDAADHPAAKYHIREALQLYYR